jgi:hypothetical protein
MVLALKTDHFREEPFSTDSSGIVGRLTSASAVNAERGRARSLRLAGLP